MISALKAIIAMLTSLVVMITSPAFGDFGGAFSPDDIDKCNLNFAAIADTHLYDDASQRILLELGLHDMENSDTRLDALVMAGDVTNNGSSVQYEQLAKAFNAYDPADNVIYAIGNHDTWNKEIDPDNRFPESERLFFKYQKQLFNRDLEKVYYTTEVNGYTFIVIGSEDDTTKTTMSDEQFEWFKTEMAKAAQKDLPIFVISHASLDNMHGLPATWFSNPDECTEEEFIDHDGTFTDGRSAELYKIIKKYDNVFLISGHIHNGLANERTYYGYKYSTIESDGSFHSVNLPSYGNTNVRGTLSSGVGVNFEVYDNEVIIKGRGFSGGVWYTDYFYSIPIV